MWYEAIIFSLGAFSGWVVLERPYWITDHIVEPVKKLWDKHIVQRLKRLWAKIWND